MLIRTQDHKIVNFGQMGYLEIIDNSYVGEYAIWGMFGSSGCTIGIYSTKMRAQEVLEEITSHPTKYVACIANGEWQEYEEIYNMPEK